MHFSHRSYLRLQRDHLVSYIFKELTGNKPPQLFDGIESLESRANSQMMFQRTLSSRIQAGEFTSASSS